MLSGLRSRIPFGIGTVVMLTIAVTLVAVGIVLSHGPSEPAGRAHGFGQLRNYSATPETAWSRSIDDLPGFTGSGPVTVADTHAGSWLLAYPSGLGRAFLAVNRYDGKSQWAKPVVAGLGSCAFDGRGQAGCAIKVGNVPDGFYLVDPGSGELGERQPLEDSGRVIGAGKDFIRVNQIGYRVSSTGPDGKTKWSRTFADAATPTYIPEVSLVDVQLADASHVLLDPQTGHTKLNCGPCTITVYPTGLAVAHGGDNGVIDFYAFNQGKLNPRATHTSRSMQLSPGPAVLAVVGGTATATVNQTHGQYEIRDPAKAKGLWAVDDDELSKARPMACGRLVAFGRKDGSREVMRLDAKGTIVGRLPAPDRQRPDTALAELRCVGSSGEVLVAANDNQVTAFDATTGRIRWEFPANGTAQNVDGFIVLRQGAQLSLLR